MRWLVASVCVLGVACEPVLLKGEAGAGSIAPATAVSAGAGRADGGQRQPGAIAAASPGDVTAGNSADSGAPSAPNAPTANDDRLPTVRVTVKSSDCGRCFELTASAIGGLPPYQFEWEDGSQGPQRHACVAAGQLEVSVVAQDANALRASSSLTVLAADGGDAGCPVPPPTAKLCLMNPSFEGTPAVNVAQNFDCPPWNACGPDPASNTPDIGNDTLSPLASALSAPKPVDGKTYLGLAFGEQVSQTLCEAVPGGTELSLQFDLARFELAQDDPANVFLEIWGGVAADCSQRQLLWASPALKPGWTRYCAPLQPSAYMDQITLRGNADATPLPEYVLVDNLVPVDQCP
jgi:hypothetical protein